MNRDEIARIFFESGLIDSLGLRKQELSQLHEVMTAIERFADLSTAKHDAEIRRLQDTLNQATMVKEAVLDAHFAAVARERKACAQVAIDCGGGLAVADLISAEILARGQSQYVAS